MNLASLANIHGLTGFLFTSLLLVSITTLFANHKGYKTFVLRGVEIVATLQFLLGLSLVVWLFTLGGFRAPLHYWLHIVFALTTLRLVGVAVTRVSQQKARRQNVFLYIGVVVLAVTTLAIGHFQVTV